MEILTTPIVIFALIVFVYFIPVTVAMYREEANTAQVFVVNLFFGWSLLGWVIALVMALRSPPPTTTVIIREEVTKNEKEGG